MIVLSNRDCTGRLAKIMTKDTIIVTDPPFNINYHYNTYKDKIDEEEYYQWLADIFKNRKSVIVHYPEQLFKLAIKMNNAPTGVAVINMNKKQNADRNFIGYEIDEKYFNIAKERIMLGIKIKDIKEEK